MTGPLLIRRASVRFTEAAKRVLHLPRYYIRGFFLAGLLRSRSPTDSWCLGFLRWVDSEITSGAREPRTSHAKKDSPEIRGPAAEEGGLPRGVARFETRFCGQATQKSIAPNFEGLPRARGLPRGAARFQARFFQAHPQKIEAVPPRFPADFRGWGPKRLGVGAANERRSLNAVPPPVLSTPPSARSFFRWARVGQARPETHPLPRFSKKHAVW
jgi:hypothetical protein